MVCLASCSLLVWNLTLGCLLSSSLLTLQIYVPTYIVGLLTFAESANLPLCYRAVLMVCSCCLGYQPSVHHCVHFSTLGTWYPFSLHALWPHPLSSSPPSLSPVPPALSIRPVMSGPLYLLTGDDITFNCYDTVGHPPPTISWMFRGNALMNGE